MVIDGGQEQTTEVRSGVEDSLAQIVFRSPPIPDSSRRHLYDADDTRRGVVTNRGVLAENHKISSFPRLPMLSVHLTPQVVNGLAVCSLDRSGCRLQASPNPTARLTLLQVLRTQAQMITTRRMAASLAMIAAQQMDTLFGRWARNLL